MRITNTDPGPAGAVQTCSVPTCSYSYSSGRHTIRIEGVPRSGAALLSTDGCEAAYLGDCAITLNGHGATVTERFAQSALLSVTLAPAGSVQDFSSNDPPLSCSAPTCTENLAIGSAVTFTAKPYNQNPSSLAGCDRSSGASCTVIMTGPRRVNAYLNYMLTAGVQAAAGSAGTVTSSLGGINCGVVASGVTPYAANIQAGQMVTLTAHPDSQSTFSSWSGTACPNATGPTCTVTMSQARIVTANFALIPGAPGPPPPPATYPLSVIVTNNQFAPSDTGYVTSSPAGIECGTVPAGNTATCNASFDAGTRVTLTATIYQGVFELWTGCDTMTYLTCTGLMGQARSVTAQFG